MDDLLNDADQIGGEGAAASNEPVSIRDSLVAALEETKSGSDDKRTRDDKGRFADDKAEPAAKAKPDAAPKATDDAPAADKATKAPVEPAATVPATQGVKPPPGWSNEAKAAFDAIPDHVKVAIAKREQEIDNGFRVLQDYKGLERFSPTVKQAGTTFADAFERYMAAENYLRTNPIEGLRWLAQSYGVRPEQLIGQAQPAQAPQAIRQAPVQRPIDLESTVDTILRKRETESQVSSFLADPSNTHADAVIDEMVALISAGRATTLKDAYDMAIWARPDIRETLINQRIAPPAQTPNKAAAADQARRASKSISGSSGPGPSRDATSAPPSSIRDSLRAAMSASGSRA